MLLPRQTPHLYQHQDKPVNERFSLLCWNIHKENMLAHFQAKLHELLHTRPCDFLLLQEYKMAKHHPHDFRSLSYAMAPNIETKEYIFGLLTASSSGFESKHAGLSEKREFLVSTRKSTLLTTHSFADGESLCLLNMHGINFTSSKAFHLELEKVKSMLKSYSGAMIVSGDFNNWSKKRMQLLETFQDELSLTKAQIEEAHHIKRIFSKPIDHIFYRGVKLLRAEAIDTKKVSDHNPIYATFEKL